MPHSTLRRFNTKNNGCSLKGKRWKCTQVVDCWPLVGGARTKAVREYTYIYSYRWLLLSALTGSKAETCCSKLK